jgi:hypothetical protein
MLTFWEKAGLKSIDTRVIRIVTSYADFDDFWRSNVVGVGPVGKALHNMAPNMREQIRSRVHESLVTNSNGTVTYEAFANVIKGRAPE